jgi:ABC-type dipeptide/oligopeptide/nickel transport system permease subunit
MGGLVIVAVATVAVVLAPWILPYEPDYGQPWIGAQPPGYAHPAALAENRFDKGEPVVVSEGIPDVVREALSSDGTLVYTVHEIESVEYRVKTRRGRVDRLTRLEGAEAVPRIEVKGEREYLQRLYEDGTTGPELHDVAVVDGEPLPQALATTDAVLVVRLRRPRTPGPERIEVVIRGGRAASIVRGGAGAEKLRLNGRDVMSVQKDGTELVLRHALGTDLQGHDVLSRVVYGGRISLLVGAIATLVTVLIGVVYGAIAGYLAQKPVTLWGTVAALLAPVAGITCAVLTRDSLGFAGRWVAATGIMVAVLWGTRALGRAIRWSPRLTTVGDLMMRSVDILDALPFMFLVILLMISFGRDIKTLFVALGAVQWLMMARIVRGQVLSLKEKEFVEAARMCGTGNAGIIFRHLIPNTLGVVVVYATLTVPAIILQESFLAFIGLTVEYGGRTLDSWGSLVNQGRQALTDDGGNWWVLVFPSAAMAVTLFSLNFLGDGLRDALDPRLKGKA